MAAAEGAVVPTPTSPATSGNPMSRRSLAPPPSAARRRKPKSPPSDEAERAGVASPPPCCAVVASAVLDKRAAPRRPALPRGALGSLGKTNRSGDNKSSPCARVRNVGRATWSSIAEIGGDPICRDHPLGLSQRQTPRADELVEHKFQLVLPVGSPTVGRIPRLGPQVPRIRRGAAQPQRGSRDPPRSGSASVRDSRTQRSVGASTPRYTRPAAAPCASTRGYRSSRRWSSAPPQG